MHDTHVARVCCAPMHLWSEMIVGDASFRLTHVMEGLLYKSTRVQEYKSTCIRFGVVSSDPHVRDLNKATLILFKRVHKSTRVCLVSNVSMAASLPDTVFIFHQSHL